LKSEKFDENYATITPRVFLLDLLIMKKILGIVVLSFLLSGNANAIEDKDFYVTCTAKGNLNFAEHNLIKTIVDEYKITIGEDQLGLLFPNSVLLVNTNANSPKFHLFRNPFDNSITYSDRVMWIDTKYKTEKHEVYQSADISLISGLYNVYYKDGFQEYSAIGECSGLVPVLSYLENTLSKSKSSYLDYWWAVILIIAIAFFIFTQSGKRLKKIRRK
jgi:hypothetical protein